MWMKMKLSLMAFNLDCCFFKDKKEAQVKTEFLKFQEDMEIG
jgi:hypothetical protein